MTICIAALCDNGESCVVAADRMAVYGSGSLLEFKLDDHARKLHKLTDHSVLLYAGSAQDAESVVAKTRAASITEEGGIRQVVDKVVEELLRAKRDLEVSRVLGPGFDYEKLITAMGNAPAGPLYDLWQKVRNIDLADLLLIAPDATGYAIHWLSPPRFATKSDLHHASVGSGGIYARAALTIQQYSKSAKVSEALFQVYSAKKAAEIVYGVGEPTDMAVVTQNGVKELEPATLELLEEYRVARSRFLLSEQESLALKHSIGGLGET